MHHITNNIHNRYFTIHLNVQFTELIGDFIKDESGTWWLINVKGFLIQDDPIYDVKIITCFGDEGYTNA